MKNKTIEEDVEVVLLLSGAILVLGIITCFLSVFICINRKKLCSSDQKKKVNPTPEEIKKPKYESVYAPNSSFARKVRAHLGLPRIEEIERHRGNVNAKGDQEILKKRHEASINIKQNLPSNLEKEYMVKKMSSRKAPRRKKRRLTPKRKKFSSSPNSSLSFGGLFSLHEERIPPNL
eukprot:snap_masked-scaffold_6-processed-gene-5.40-mRNA-1 protein AED:1.00 eAED:1.00 QI:0/-1/0/0/-1/1/1/0/176